MNGGFVSRHMSPHKMSTIISGIYNKYRASLFDCLIVFNATFNNISVISGRSFLLVEETGGPGENHRPVTSH